MIEALIVLILVGGIGIGLLYSYIVTGIGLTRLSRKMDLEFPWLAWVPLTRNYLLIKLGKKSDNMIFMYGAMWLFGTISLGATADAISVGFILIFIGFYIWSNVYTSILYYEIGKELNVSNGMLVTLTIIMPLRCILLFSMYNMKEKVNNNLNYENIER